MRLGVCLALLVLARAGDAPLQPFADYFFDARLFGGEKVSLDDYLKLKQFQDLVRERVDASHLTFDERIDLELLHLVIDGRREAYRLHQRGAETPFDQFLLPSNFAHQWVSLLPDSKSLIAHAKNAAEKIRAFKLPALSTAQAEAGRAQLDKMKSHLKATLDIFKDEGAKAVVGALEELSAAIQEIKLEADPKAQAPPDASPEPAVLYQHLLRYQIYTDYSPQSLLEFGKANFDKTLKDLEALARRINPRKSWVDLVEETKQKQFTRDTLHDESGKLAFRAMQFAIDKDLVSVPPAARDFEIRRADPKAITPFGHYQPRDGEKKGAYISAPLPEKAPPEELDQRMRDNNLYWTTVVALHETVPGHHLQFEVARDLKRPKIRQLFHPTTYIEGWGLYCEHMMFLNGYFGDDPLYELTLLRMKLWRCARILIDVGLQTRKMTKDEAVDLLVKQVRLEPVSAKFEVEHYQSRPTYFTGYLIGYEFFVGLRKKCEAAMGSDFNQKAFHDKLLSVGPLPMAQLERVMLHWAKPD
jgi:uncharacterized protein (DUF885 family)